MIAYIVLQLAINITVHSIAFALSHNSFPNKARELRANTPIQLLHSAAAQRKPMNGKIFSLIRLCLQLITRAISAYVQFFFARLLCSGRIHCEENCKYINIYSTAADFYVYLCAKA